MPRLAPLLIAILVWQAGLASAQVRRLPPVDPASGSLATAEPALMASLPDPLTQPPLPDLPPPKPETAEEDDVSHGARSGFFQKAKLTETYLLRGNGDSLGMDDVDLYAMFGLPAPTRQSPLLLTPGFGLHTLEGPTAPDLPARLYDAYFECFWMPRISPTLTLHAMITPGVYGDFERSEQVFRLTGYGAAQWQWQPRLKLLLGAAYFDRRDYNILPVGGLLWTPRDDVKLDLVFPRPRLAYRFASEGPEANRVESWLYISGELGGGTWGYRRSDGQSDQVTYGDLRLILGLQHQVIGGLDWRTEIGYVFSRKLQFADQPDVELDDTMMLRAGVTY
jgi:hypothetical protein